MLSDIGNKIIFEGAPTFKSPGYDPGLLMNYVE